MNHTISIYGEQYSVQCNRKYNANTQPVIEIFEVSGCPAGVISVCIPSHPFAENETAISSDVPQEEVMRELERTGLATRTGEVALSGFGQYPVVKILGFEPSVKQ